MNSRRLHMKELISKNGLIVAPGAFDALSARIIERAGFLAVYLTGGGISRSWGYPDLGLMTMTENLSLISRVCDSVNIPVIADGDTGYGNALNVIRTIREFEKAGVTAMHLEDQVTPKRCGHYEGKEVITKGEMVSKIKAATDTRKDGLIIIARTDARAIYGLDEAIQRGISYVEAGADVIFVEAPQSLDEIRKIAASIPAPLMINMIKGSRTPMLNTKEIENLGYKIAIYPNEAHRAAIWAVNECVNHLKINGNTKGYDQMVGFDMREELVGTPYWKSLSAKYGAETN